MGRNNKKRKSSKRRGKKQPPRKNNGKDQETTDSDFKMPSSEDRRGRPKTLRRSQRKRTRPETAAEFAFHNYSHVKSLAQARATFEGNSDKFVNVYRYFHFKFIIINVQLKANHPRKHFRVIYRLRRTIGYVEEGQQEESSKEEQICQPSNLYFQILSC